MKYPQLSKDVLYDMYWVEEKSLAKIGEEVGCGSTTVQRYMMRLCIPRRSISESQMGEKHFNYEKHLSEETRKRQSKSHKGKHFSEETRRKMSGLHKGKHLSEETRRKMSESRKGEKHYNYGKHRDEETRKKISESNKGLLKGEKHHNWQGGISYAPYCPEFNFTLKEKVREKYGRKCFLCGKTEKENGEKLSVHHIDGDKMQGCESKKWMLVPLCRSCHGKIQHNKTLNNKLLAKLKNVEGTTMANDLCPTMGIDHYLKDVISV